jgi:hypothetical protein
MAIKILKAEYFYTSVQDQPGEAYTNGTGTYSVHTFS